MLRSYGFHDAFRGSLTDSGTTFMERPAIQWLAERSLAPHDIEGFEDIQTARLFPIVATIDQLGQMLHYMIDSPDMIDSPGREDLREVWMKAEKLAADSLLLAAPSPALPQKGKSPLPSPPPKGREEIVQTGNNMGAIGTMRIIGTIKNIGII